MQNSTDRIIAVIQAIIAVSSLCVSAYAITSHDEEQKEMDPYEKVQYCAGQVRDRIDTVPTVAIVLGSGMSEVAEMIEDPTVIPYSEIDGFPRSTVHGHSGNFVVGKLSGVDVIVMQGRVHYYEGYSTEEVVLPLRVMHELGAGTLILTNAAGSLKEEMAPGTFMIITDQILYNVPSPLIGPNISELGERFPSMQSPYNETFGQKFAEKLREQIPYDSKLTVSSGVYIQVSGPQYESATEVNAYGMWGADAVGMSTGIEVIAARHMGMDVCGVSCITNYATGISGSYPSHEEVVEMMEMMNSTLSTALQNLVGEINRERS